MLRTRIAGLLLVVAAFAGCDAWIFANGGVYLAPEPRAATDSSTLVLSPRLDSAGLQPLHGVFVGLFRHRADAEASINGTIRHDAVNGFTDWDGTFRFIEQCAPLFCDTFFLVVDQPGYQPLIRRVTWDSLYYNVLRVTLVPTAGH